MNKPKSNRDAVLVEEYAKIPNLSSESIIRDDSLSSSLMDRVNSHLPEDLQFEKDELKKRLENLRKGGILPKKFRKFNGRDMSKKNPK